MPSEPVPQPLPTIPRATGCLLLAPLLAAVLFVSLPRGMWWQRVAQDAGHGLVFVGVAFVLLLMTRPPAGVSMRPPATYLRVLAAACAIGILTELLQYFLPQRSVSAMDALRDAAGATVGLAFGWWLERRLARRSRTGRAPEPASALVAAAALAALSLLAWQPLQTARAYAERRAALPQLLPADVVAGAEFVRSYRASLGQASLPTEFKREGDPGSLRLQFQPGGTPALQLTEPYPDWRRYEVLAIDATNPGATPASLVVRIIDDGHDWSSTDRFNLPVVIPAATRTTVRVSLEAVAASPATRRMDLGAIRNVVIYARRPLDGSELYFTRVWLD